MKKLFTFCATALFALTLSAQVEQAEGSWYLGTGADATELLNLFNDTGASMAATIGYAVQDDLIVSGTVSNGEAADEDNVYDVTVTYFKNGFGFGATVLNAMEGNGGERTISLSVGKMMMLGAVSDKLYLYPNVSMNKDQQFNSAISFGLKF